MHGCKKKRLKDKLPSALFLSPVPKLFKRNETKGIQTSKQKQLIPGFGSLLIQSIENG